MWNAATARATTTGGTFGPSFLRNPALDQALVFTLHALKARIHSARVIQSLLIGPAPVSRVVFGDALASVAQPAR